MKGKRLKRTGRLMKKYWILYLMLLAPIAALIIFHYVPFYGILMAFQNYKPSLGVSGSQWVGFKHFETFINYPYFGRLIKNTLTLSLYALACFPMPIVLAIMFNEIRSNRLKKTCQTILYLPHFVSTVVVCGMTLMFIKEDGGLINMIIEAFGGEAKEWISFPELFPLIYQTSGVWTSLGWGTILYTASLASLSQEHIEAARMDGASRIQIIRHIYIPHLKPIIIIQLILQLGGILSVGFEKAYLLQNPLNLTASSIISTYSYGVGLVGGEYSYAAAIGLFNNIISIIMVLTTNFISKKVSDERLGLI